MPLRTLCMFAIIFWITGTLQISQASGAEGFMIRVTAEDGAIKSGTTVLARVPQSTRLWCFQQNESGWYEVKCPDTNQHGFIHRTNAEPIRLSAAQQERITQVVESWKQLRVLRQKHLYQEMETVLKSIININASVQGKDHPYYAMALATIGDVQRRLKKIDEAKSNYDRAIVIQRRVLGDQHIDTARTYHSVGGWYYEQTNFESAIDYYQRALKIYEKKMGKQSANAGYVHQDLANLYTHSADFPKARAHASSALAIFEKEFGEEHESTLGAINSIARIESAVGNYSAGRSMFEKALEIEHKISASKKSFMTAILCNNLAYLLRKMGDYDSAETYAERAYQLFVEIDGERSYYPANVLLILGDIEFERGNFEAARRNFHHSLSIRMEILGEDHYNTAETLLSLGKLEKQLGELESAEQRFRGALAVFRKLYGDSQPMTCLALTNLAELAQADGKPDVAKEYYENALRNLQKIYDDNHPEIAMALQKMAWFHLENEDIDLAVQTLQQARQVVRRHEALVLPALTEKEQLLFLNRVHTQSWVKSLSFAYHNPNNQRLASLSAGWLINGKAVAQEALAEGALLSRPETAPLVKELRTVRSAIASLLGGKLDQNAQQRLSELETQQQDLIRQIGASGTGLSKADPWISIGEVRGKLAPGTVMINFARLEPLQFSKETTKNDHYYAWVIPAMDEGRVQILDLGPAKTIDDAIDHLQSMFLQTPKQIERLGEEPATAVLNQQLQHLSTLVWKPISDEVGESQDLIISPEGALWLVPWSALPSDGNRFLIEDFTIRYVVSGREIAGRRTNRSGIGAPVVFADPDFDSSLRSNTIERIQLAQRFAANVRSVNRLPGTANEAKAIAPTLEQLSGKAPLIYLEANATEGNFKQVFRPQYLVASTHGFYFDRQKIDGPSAIENPLLRCGLLLAGCNRPSVASSEDGVLSGLEIVGTDLRGTELVVLSACQTGVGEIRSGEGVAGLRQAFQLAGAQGVVATLWQIPDQETVQLVNDFFRNLANRTSHHEALRQSQLKLIESRRRKYGVANPYYWAAFTITGSE